MNRLVAVLTALFLAPAALAQDAAAPAPQAAPAAEGPDVAALEGKLESLAEQVAELKTGVDGLRKLKLSGYVQARHAWQEEARYTGADNPSRQNFFIRRGRIKATYDASWAQYVLQLDAIPGSVSVKEAFAEVKLPGGLAVDAGLQLFPFGYEVGVRSSADLDLLERSRAVSYFLAGEYDLGVSLKGASGPFNFRVGLYNGNGVEGAPNGRDNDPLKDVIGRVGYDFGFLTGGFSGWYGKTRVYTAGVSADHDRLRAGADVQLYLDLLPLGGTAVKGEYIWGKTGLASANRGVGSNLGVAASGWYALVTQNVGPWNQLAVRYERFNTAHDRDDLEERDDVQVALHTFLGDNYKLSAAWFHPLNDTAGEDPEADQFIVQAQAKF